MDKNNNSDQLSDDDTKKLMTVEYAYPEPTDPDFQYKIYNKREYHINRFPRRKKLNTYKEIEKYRDNICTGNFQIREQQAFLGKFINPNTPYKGVLIMHGTGTGKCLAKDQRVHIIENNRTVKSYLSIETIFNKYKGMQSISDGEGSWHLLKSPVYVESMNTKKELLYMPVKYLYQQKVDELMDRITLSNGNVIKVTKKHNLLTDQGWQANIANNPKIKYIAVPIKYNKNIVESPITKPLSSDFILVEIDTIEEYRYSDYVYDLEVETHHNFIAENTLVSNTCAGITIAEGFKELVSKYNTKIHVLVGGPLIKESWKTELYKCAGDAYIAKTDQTKYVSTLDKEKIKKNVVSSAMQYYKFLSYNGFYKKVLGEKVIDEVKTVDSKTKTVYKKTTSGDFERDLSSDRIVSINNSLIIVDEAHHLTNNYYGEALMKIIKNSVNLKVVLLTATPMKNLADDLIELINFIRPINKPLKRENIFNQYKNHLMDIKPGGVEYLKKMTRGYISFLRGADPITFAQRREVGEIPKGLISTPLVRCQMLPFQKKLYDKIAESSTDALDKQSEAIANFVFPGISSDGKTLQGYFGREGIRVVKNQALSNSELVNTKIAKEIFNETKFSGEEYISYSSFTNNINGRILEKDNLKHFSSKFYSVLTQLEGLVWSQKGAGTAFLYSNLVKTGIEIFQEILIKNGYLEYEKNNSEYKISNDTKCYFCGQTYKKHISKESLSVSKDYNMIDSSITMGIKDEFTTKTTEPPSHSFYPAVFIPVTGKSSESFVDLIQEEKQIILNTIFNKVDNKNGKHIKFILGSQVMTEGINLANVREVHILDASYHLGRVDQVIGRAIRYCRHYDLMSEDNPYPVVNIYKYVVALPDQLSSEEILYQKAELKYYLVKQVERILQENAIDCPLNMNNNVFPEEIEKYKDCINPLHKNKEGQLICPGKCNYMACEYQCVSEKLNKMFWDPEKKMYRKILKDDLDYTTFTNDLSYSEVQYAKDKIKEMYKLKSFYSLKEIVDYVRANYIENKKDLFDEYFVFKALDQLIPIDENDFNNYNGDLYDKFNRIGYLIHIDKYYIFQTFDQPENMPMYYRNNYHKHIGYSISLKNYLKANNQYKISKTEQEKKGDSKRKIKYDFESVIDYYDSREENNYVGVIDLESTNKISIRKAKDIFKIRPKRKRIADIKRATGMPSIRGSVCATSKTKSYLVKIAKSLDIKIDKKIKRSKICQLIKEKLLFLEKYSTGKDKMTYLMIPKNHLEYKFPLNIDDRIEFIENKIYSKVKSRITIKKNKIKKKVNDINVTTYQLVFENNRDLNDIKSFLVKMGGDIKKGKWEILID